MRIGDWSLTSVRSAASSARSTLTSYSPQTPATARIWEPFGLPRPLRRDPVIDPGLPYADGQTAPCWLAITPDWGYLFAVNAGSQTISRYEVAPDGTLTVLGPTPVKGADPVPLDTEVSPDGRTL